MIRAAAKNHNSVAVVVDKDDYGLIIEELKKDGKVLEKTLKNLALKAYSRTAAYDSAISNWMNKQLKDGDQTYKSFGGKKYNHSDMVKTLIKKRHFILMEQIDLGLLPPNKSKEKSLVIIISMIPTPHLN